MGVNDLLAPWSGAAYRHVPADDAYNVLDFETAGLAADNRWNFLGERTLYVASDRAVAIAEFARHYRERSVSTVARQSDVRRIFRLHLQVEHLLDLRDPHVLELLSIGEPPYRLLERRVARAVAHYLRFVTAAQAILVPSAAFLDDLTRWVAVLFLDKLPADPRAFVTAVEAAGTFRLDV